MNRQSLIRSLAGSLLLGLPLLSGCRGDAPADGGSPEVQMPADAGGAGDEPVVPPNAETPEVEPETAAGVEEAGVPDVPAPPASVVDSRFAPGGEVTDAELGKYHVEMTGAIDGEEVGTMTFEMWTEDAPITTRNFLRLVDEGFYDGLSFHRILRTFMIQGGDPTGTGAGNSPHGTIQAEFSDEPHRAHGYGVLSMARMGSDPDSASCQFFLCCDESPSVWGLDNKYTSFGRLTSGVETLEKLANVPTTFSRTREKSKPLATVTIASARVVEGEAPKGETIERPAEALDLKGEPERIVVQHVLISFAGRGVGDVSRTEEEAKALAETILERTRAGESMDALVREFSDDPVDPDDDTPGHYGILNSGVRDMAGERKMFQLQDDFRTAIEDLQAQMREGKLTQAEFQTQAQALQAEAQKEASKDRFMNRSGLVAAFGDVGFGLEVGEVGLATFDAAKSPFGYHVIKRIE